MPPARLAREAALRARQGVRPPLPAFSLPANEPDPIYVERALRIARKAREGKPSEAVSTLLDYQSRLEQAPLLRLIADALGESLLVDEHGETAAGYARRVLVAAGAEAASTPLTVRLFKRADQWVPNVHLRASADALVTLCGEELDPENPRRHVLFAPRGTFTRGEGQFDCKACREAAGEHPDALETLRFDPLSETEHELIAAHAGAGIRAAARIGGLSLDTMRSYAREHAPAGIDEVALERLLKMDSGTRIERWFGHFPSCEDYACHEYHEFGFLRDVLSERYSDNVAQLPQPDEETLRRALAGMPRLVEPQQARLAGDMFRAGLIAEVWPEIVDVAAQSRWLPQSVRELLEARGLGG